MKTFRANFPNVVKQSVSARGAFVFAGAAPAQQPAPQQAASRYDVTNYRIEAQLIPDQHQLRAGADITVVPLEATRSLVFELNGSLKVESIERDGKALTGFVQDAVGAGSLGPNVRVDLGQVMPANQPMTLRFRWSGALLSPEGGPLATKRLAYVGPEGSYLMYASRWFPFHDYAADRATSDITLIVPSGLQVAGTSDDPVAPQASGKDGSSRFHFVHRKPVLIGNFAAGQYINRNLRFGNYEIQFYAKPGSEGRINGYAEMMGQVLSFTPNSMALRFRHSSGRCPVDDDSLDLTQDRDYFSGVATVRLFAPMPEESWRAKLLISGGARLSV